VQGIFLKGYNILCFTDSIKQRPFWKGNGLYIVSPFIKPEVASPSWYSPLLIHSVSHINQSTNSHPISGSILILSSHVHTFRNCHIPIKTLQALLYLSQASYQQWPLGLTAPTVHGEQHQLWSRLLSFSKNAHTGSVAHQASNPTGTWVLYRESSSRV
jgi:hypothetical protein